MRATGGPSVRLITPSTAERSLHESPLASYWSSVVLRRLELQDLLPDLDRVLCLDADLLVREDIGALWDQGIREDCPLRMAIETLTPFGYAGLQERGLRPRAPYFNCGVMDLNLRVLRNRMAEAVNVLQKFPDLMFPEMDALNLAFQNEIDRIESRWHVQLHSYYRMFGSGASPAELGGVIDVDEARAAVERPAIIHFLERWKPWHVDAEERHGAFAKEWEQHARSTVWRDDLSSFAVEATTRRLRRELDELLRPLDRLPNRRGIVAELVERK